MSAILRSANLTARGGPACGSTQSGSRSLTLNFLFQDVFFIGFCYLNERRPKEACSERIVDERDFKKREPIKLEQELALSYELITLILLAKIIFPYIFASGENK